MNLSCTKNNISVESTPNLTAGNAININTATAEELEHLPHIGNDLALRIEKHRSKFGKFRRTEHLMLVKGISDKKFREIQSLVKVE